MKDKEGYHRYRKQPLCPEAVEYSRAKGKAKYAAAQARQGKKVTPMRERGWIPGSPIEIPEVDPL